MYPPFSVLISIYQKESPFFFQQAFDSIFYAQTVKPTEIILIKDGPLTPELDECIDEYKRRLQDTLKVYALEENQGLGKALNYGLTKCSYELVARMDADDFATSNRFEKQLQFLNENPDIDVCGSALEEFQQRPGDLGYIRFSKERHEDIVNYARMRNPLNHPTVIYKKSKVLSAGSYQDMPGYEDYYLWVRMIQNGAKMANLKTPLLHFRLGNGMVERRSGWAYIRQEYAFFNTIKKDNFLSIGLFLALIVTRLPLRLLPKTFLRLLYNKLRTKNT